VLGYRIAEALGARAFLTKYGSTVVCSVVGFTTDLDLINTLYRSLTRQCSLSLATWYTRWVNGYFYAPSGTQKYNAKRGFISGFGNGVKDKLSLARKEAVTEAGHGAQLVLVDRGKQLDDWLDANTKLTTNGRRRRYDSSARGSGYAAGQRADVGQSGPNVWTDLCEALAAAYDAAHSDGTTTWTATP